MYEWTTKVDDIKNRPFSTCMECHKLYTIMDSTSTYFCGDHAEDFDNWCKEVLDGQTIYELQLNKYEHLCNASIEKCFILQYLNGYIDSRYINHHMRFPLCLLCSDSLMKYDSKEDKYIDEYIDPEFDDICKNCMSFGVLPDFGFVNIGEFYSHKMSRFDLYDWYINSVRANVEYFEGGHCAKRFDSSELNLLTECVNCGTYYVKEYVTQFLSHLNPVTKKFICARCVNH